MFSETFYWSAPSNDWWRVSTYILSPKSDSAAPLTNGVHRVRLTGLSSNLTSETLSIDILGNTNRTATAIDRAAKTVTQTVQSPDSTNAAVSVTVNGLAMSSEGKTGHVTTTFAHDALGRQTNAVTLSAGGTRSVASTTQYNALGQVAWTEDAASNRTSYAYDPATGRRIAVTNALGQATHQHFDPEGRLLATWGATYPVAYEYDDQGRMSAMYTLRDSAVALTNYASFQSQVSSFDKTTWQYDEATGLLTNKLYADNNGTADTYTPDGKLATRTWARGVTTTYAYDAATGAMTNIAYGGSAPDVTFVLDRLGRQTSITDGTGTRTFTYNDSLQLAAETNVMGSIDWQYDSLGRGIGYTLGAGPLVGYEFDSVGRLAAVTSSVDSATIGTAYSFLPNADLIAGWSNNVGFAVARFFESNRDLLLSVSNGFGAGVTALFDYQNDVLGRRTARIDDGAVTNLFAYDALSQLTNAVMGANGFGYQYDPIGNRLTASSNAVTHLYTANALNQYTAITNGGPRALAYDRDGNLTNDTVFAYTWDGENRLIKFESASGVPDAFKVCVENVYDYAGRRVKKTVKDDYSGGTYTTTNVTTFIYNGWLPIAEIGNGYTNYMTRGLDASGTLNGAGGCGGLLSKTTVTASDTNTYFYLYDGNANVIGMVDEAGSVVASYEYSPFGVCIKATGSQADSNAFRYSTHYFDSETGIYNGKRRYYSPSVGSYLSRDPVGERGGLRLYAYTDNDPIGFIDPFGLWKATSESKGKSRRVYQWEDGDTLQSLAKEVGLDYNEIFKWARPGFDVQGALGESFGSLLGGAWKNYCYVSVPNVWISADLLRGTPSGSWYTWPFRWGYYRAVNVGGTIGRFVGTDVFTHGYKIEKPNTPRELDDAISDNAGDLWGLVIFAHGNEYGIISDSTMRNWTTQMELLKRVDQNGFKLAKAYPLQCFSGFSGELTVADPMPYVGFANPFTLQTDPQGYTYWTMKVDWDAQWKRRAIHVKTYEGMNVIGIDW